ncbi:MAG: hypothetical protein PHV32_06455 [Eubacteriales bacterium]|nr:hypothetical protein [Eubacteriales bacterium]
MLIDSLSHGRTWNKNSLWCENPDEKKTMTVGGLWWPIMGVRDDLRKLKENNRLTI